MSSNIKNINQNDFKSICRVCMCDCDMKFYLDHVVSSVLYKLTDLRFETNDELPQQICSKCFEKIREINEFALQCKQTYSALVECLINFKQIKLEEEELQETINNVKEEITIVEHKIEFVKDEQVSNETNEINYDQNIIESNDNTSNIDTESDKDTDYNYTSLDDPVTVHMRTHSGERPYKICDCSKSPSFDVRPYKCTQCSKSYTKSCQLSMHMHTHSGKRPYKCSQCSKSFIEPFNLKQHMLVHSGERPFKCSQCSKSFIQSSRLSVHMRTHSSERPYKCSHCSKSFVRSDYLVKHMRTHSTSDQ